jgi:peptidylprolyl isomerase
VVKYNYLVLVGILMLGAVLLPGCTAGQGAKNGDTVQVIYTGKLADGTVFDSNVGKEPFSFTLGEGKVVPGFDKAVLGMKVGEKKTVTIKAKDAYGTRSDDNVVALSRDRFPAGGVPKVGDQLQMVSTEGKKAIGTVIKVSDAAVTIDVNHPLAGKDLTFEIELVKIQ